MTGYRLSEMTVLADVVLSTAKIATAFRGFFGMLVAKGYGSGKLSFCSVLSVRFVVVLDNWMHLVDVFQ